MVVLDAVGLQVSLAANTSLNSKNKKTKLPQKTAMNLFKTITTDCMVYTFLYEHSQYNCQIGSNYIELYHGILTESRSYRDALAQKHLGYSAIKQLDPWRE